LIARVMRASASGRRKQRRPVREGIR